MKRKLGLLLVAIMLVFCLVGCGEAVTSTVTATSTEEPIKLSFMAEFYDNEGLNWLNVEGSNFDIKPNKVKQYGYSSDGSWDYWYETSSIVSVVIDDKDIETCGSTVLFYDTRLEKIDIELPTDVTLSTGDTASIIVPTDLRGQEYWTLNWWWDTKNLNNYNGGSRIVIIQSQLGDPICMFAGDEVTWDIPKNLPKTTEICIDGKMLYIHRANFAIVDTSVFE
jgi:hypothetical protein